MSSSLAASRTVSSSIAAATPNYPAPALPRSLTTIMPVAQQSSSHARSTSAPASSSHPSAGRASTSSASLKELTSLGASVLSTNNSCSTDSNNNGNPGSAWRISLTVLPMLCFCLIILSVALLEAVYVRQQLLDDTSNALSAYLEDLNARLQSSSVELFYSVSEFALVLDNESRATLQTRITILQCVLGQASMLAAGIGGFLGGGRGAAFVVVDLMAPLNLTLVHDVAANILEVNSFPELATLSASCATIARDHAVVRMSMATSGAMNCVSGSSVRTMPSDMADYLAVRKGFVSVVLRHEDVEQGILAAISGAAPHVPASTAVAVWTPSGATRLLTGTWGAGAPVDMSAVTVVAGHVQNVGGSKCIAESWPSQSATPPSTSWGRVVHSTPKLFRSGQSILHADFELDSTRLVSTVCANTGDLLSDSSEFTRTVVFACVALLLLAMQNLALRSLFRPLEHIRMWLLAARTWSLRSNDTQLPSHWAYTWSEFRALKDACDRASEYIQTSREYLPPALRQSVSRPVPKNAVEVVGAAPDDGEGGVNVLHAPGTQQDADSTELSSSLGGTLRRMGAVPTMRRRPVAVVALSVVDSLSATSSLSLAQSIEAVFSVVLRVANTHKGVPIYHFGDFVLLSYNDVVKCQAKAFHACSTVRDIDNELRAAAPGVKVRTGTSVGLARCGEMGCGGMRCHSLIGGVVNEAVLMLRLNASLGTYHLANAVMHPDIVVDFLCRVRDAVYFRRSVGEKNARGRLLVMELTGRKTESTWLFSTNRNEERITSEYNNAVMTLFNKNQATPLHKFIATYRRPQPATTTTTAAASGPGALGAGPAFMLGFGVAPPPGIRGSPSSSALPSASTAPTREVLAMVRDAERLLTLSQCPPTYASTFHN
eukprot:PhM_4_TR18803/c5_g1_i4/m.91569